MSRVVAVTGATGFIGRHVTKDLVARGMDVRAIVRPESRYDASPGVTIVRAPLDVAALTDACAGSDAVVHLAGVVHALDAGVYTAVNVEGTRAVAEAASAAGSRLVHISSLAAAGSATAASPRAEDGEPSPLTPYGRSKLEGERLVAATSGLRWIILRPGVIYGPGDRAMLPLFKSAERGLLPLVGRAGASYTFVHVSDVVRAIAAAIDTVADREIIFVGHPRPVTGREILEAVRTAVGRPATVIRIPQALTKFAASTCDLVARVVGHPLPLDRWRYVELSAEGFVCSVERLRERLGVVAAIELGAGLAETAEWYRREGWIKR